MTWGSRMPAAMGERFRRRTSTDWPVAASALPSFTTRRAAGPRGPRFSPAITPNKSGATRSPAWAGGAAGQRPAWARLLPAMLNPLGYRSYHSGKWHIDGKVLAGGFDHSYSFYD